MCTLGGEGGGGGCRTKKEKKRTAVSHHALCVLHGLRQTYGNLASRAKVVILSHYGAPVSDLCPALHCNRKRPTYHIDLLILNPLFCSKFLSRFHSLFVLLFFRNLRHTLLPIHREHQPERCVSSFTAC